MAITPTFASPAQQRVPFNELTARPVTKQALHRPAPRLDSWKEIATYLKRSVRAVSRWERLEGLPVHRHHHGKQATVYALPHELDQWLQSRSGQGHAGQLPNKPQAIPATEPVGSVNDKSPLVLAVLPLRNLSDGPEAERFADGLTEELISEIGHCCPRQLRVIALTSAMQYKRTLKTIEEIGNDLRANFILEGSIQRYGDRVRLTARLIAVRDQAHIWADTYEIQLPPIFSLQQSLAQQVVDSVSAEFKLDAKKKWARFGLPSFAAHNAYLEAKSHLLPTQADTMKSVEQLNLAVDRDPTFASGYAELALTYFRRLFWDFPPIVTCKRIKENASMTLKLDPKLARAHSMMAAFELFSAWDWSKAENSIRRAIELNPSDPWGHVVQSAYSLVVGKIHEAVEDLSRIRQLDPQSVETGMWFVIFAYFARRYDLAAKLCQELLQRDPSSAFLHMVFGLNLVQSGEYALALSHCEKAKELGGNSIAQISRACTIYALAGGRDTAERLFQELVTATEVQYTRYIFLAQASACLKMEKETLEFLNKAYEQRDPLLVFLKTDPRFEAFSDLPEFSSLLQRIGLPDHSSGTTLQ